MSRPATSDLEIVNQLLQAEGWPQFTDSPHDHGGATKGGITLTTLRRWKNNPALGVEDLKALTVEVARELYQEVFIATPGFARIPDSLLRWQVVDSAVLSGQGRATAWLQGAVGVRPDGVLGAETVAAVTAADPHRVAVRFAVARLRFLAGILKNDPSQGVYIGGWVNRATQFLLLEAGWARDSPNNKDSAT